MVEPNVPDKQRALILQGGGALGAYEVGAFKALFEELPKKDAENREVNRPLFDIVAGTSSGAINAAILVKHFKDNNRSWDGAFEKLRSFWKHVSSEDPKKDVDFRIRWWNKEHKNDAAASYEAARRYYSAKYFLQNGAPRVFSRPTLILDDKFFDNSISIPNNIWIRYSNDELKQSINDFATFPITTDFPEPRLLLVSVNVEDGATVTFDSYSKESEYGRYNKVSGEFSKRIIKYEKGVELSHVMASACIPLFYNYEEIRGHKFWDGGVLSNTPLREVLQAHRDYWYKKRGKEKPDSKVPDLEVYIISVWPSGKGSPEEAPSDYDGIKERLYDIGLSDKTEYDEKTATIVSDYVEIIKKVRTFALERIKNAEQRDAFSKDLDAFLANEPVQSKGRDGGERTCASLIYGRFKLHHEVVRIELRSDSDSISNKAFDLTDITIENLIKQGEEDARRILRRAVVSNDKK